MNSTRRLGIAGGGTALAIAAALAGIGSAQASPPAGTGSAQASPPAGTGTETFTPPFIAKVIGKLPNGQPKLSSSSPTGLPPSAIRSVYNLSGLSPVSAEAPAAKIVLVEAKSGSPGKLFGAVSYANSIGASVVSMS